MCFESTMANPPPVVLHEQAALAPLFNSLSTFDPATMQLSTWLEMFDEFCYVNNIQREPAGVAPGQAGPRNQRRALFLSYLGPQAYEALRAACLASHPTCLPNTKSIPQLTALLKERFEPVGLIQANQYIFDCRDQKENESIAEYAAALQVLAVPCQFGEYRDRALRDRFVKGLKCHSTRKELLGTRNLTFEAAKTIASNNEAVDAHARRITNVHRVTAQYQQRNQQGSVEKRDT